MSKESRCKKFRPMLRVNNNKDFKLNWLKDKKDKFDFKPNSIIETLDLRRPIYLQTAAYGHFGKPDLPWERII